MTADHPKYKIFFGGIFLGLIPLSNIITILLNLVIDTPPITDINADLSIIWAFLGFCILPALIEETLFRGLLQTYLLKFGVLKAIIFTALLFTMLHMQNPVGLPAILLLSINLSIAMWLFRSLKFTILLHLINNCFAFSIYLFNYYLDENLAFILTVSLYCVFALLSMITYFKGKKTCLKPIIILWKKRLSLQKKP